MHISSQLSHALPSVDVNGMLTHINGVIQIVLDNLAPIEVKTFINRARAPWFDGKLVEALRLLPGLERIWQISKLEVESPNFSAGPNG